MKALTYIEHGKFALTDKPNPQIIASRDAIVRVTLGSICTSDLHIKHGSVPRAVPGITVGHEMVGVVEQVGSAVTTVRPGDRVTVNVETFCGECFFCQNGFVNNCVDPNGGWALGCRIDGGQAEFVRVLYADQGLNKIPETVTDEQALLVGDVLATGFWAARISEIKEQDTVLIIGAGPTGLCTLMCVMLKRPKRIIVCEKDPARIAFVKEHYPEVLTCTPEDCKAFTIANSDHGGADVVLEVAGAKDTFRLAWDCARPNAIVTVVALYDESQTLPLPQMYGKNLTFKTGGVDGCDCAEILALIEAGKIDTTPLITHRYKLQDIEEAYRIFENKLDGVIKIAIVCDRDSNIKQTRYQNLIERVRTSYPIRDSVCNGKDTQLYWCEDCKEINLWTYWQGRNNLDAKIILVGQDWGCPWDQSSQNTMKQIALANKGEEYHYLDQNPSITDYRLIRLFQEIGYEDISKANPDLFFTNFILGYRSKGISGGYQQTWADHDKRYFHELANIIEARVILCLGRSTFEGVLSAFDTPLTVRIKDYNAFIEGPDNPVAVSLENGQTAYVFALAHCGAMGTLNRNGKKSTDLSKQIEDWKKIKPYLEK